MKAGQAVAAHAHWPGDLVAARILESWGASSLHHDVVAPAHACVPACVRPHHWVGILAHADYGPALLRLPLTCRSADLGPPRPRQCGPPGPGSVVSPAATELAVPTSVSALGQWPPCGAGASSALTHWNGVGRRRCRQGSNYSRPAPTATRDPANDRTRVPPVTLIRSFAGP